MANSHMKCYLSAPSWPTCPRHENARGRRGEAGQSPCISTFWGWLKEAGQGQGWASWPTAQEAPIVDGPLSRAVSRAPACLAPHPPVHTWPRNRP